MPQQKIALSGEQTGIVREDRVAGVVITPGELLQISADGDLDPHSTAAGTALPLFALEPLGVESAAGVNIIDTDYAVGDSVRAWYAQSGAEVNAIASAAISVGDFVESDGAGRVRTVATSAATADTSREAVVGQAASAATGAADRIRIIVA